MFGLGWGEILLLAILGVVLIGPKELPQVIKSITRFVRQLSSARDEWVRTIRQDPSIREITESVEDVHQTVTKPVKSLEQILRENLQQMQAEEAEKANAAQDVLEEKTEMYEPGEAHFTESASKDPEKKS